jgi:hypothetical protein
VTRCGGKGCHGDRIDRIMEQVHAFLSGHNELVVLRFSHWCQTGPKDRALLQLIKNSLDPYIFKATEDSLATITDIPVDRMTGPGPSGKAVLLFDYMTDSDSLKRMGFFNSYMMPRSGSYANTMKLENMINNQVRKYSRFDPESPRLFEISWTLTQKGRRAVGCAFGYERGSLYEMGMKANAALPVQVGRLIEKGDIRPGRLPNIILVDFAGDFVTRECIRISEVHLQGD